MRITILGSSAAEAWPALWCECIACAEARRRGGRNLRRRTVYWLNDDTLVDFGPDIHWQGREAGVDLTHIRHLLVTHSHEDHLTPVELFWRHPGYSAVSQTLRLYSNQAVRDRLAAELQPLLGQRPLWETLQIEPVAMTPGETVSAGALRVTPIEAQHGPADEVALNYVIEQDGRAALIANDTGWWGEASWTIVQRFRLDLAIIECTYLLGTPDARNGHLGANTALAFRDRLWELGALRPEAQVVANHFTHNAGTLHEELSEFFTPRGVTAGYDGLVLEV